MMYHFNNAPERVASVEYSAIRKAFSLRREFSADDVVAYIRHSNKGSYKDALDLFGILVDNGTILDRYSM